MPYPDKTNLKQDAVPFWVCHESAMRRYKNPLPDPGSALTRYVNVCQSNNIYLTNVRLTLEKNGWQHGRQVINNFES